MSKRLWMASHEGPPGKPEARKCRHCGASVPNKLPTCPNCQRAP